jgi:hypothetical protein
LTSDESAERPPLPDHIEETFRAIGALRARHDERATAPHRMAESMTRQMTRPSS